MIGLKTIALRTNPKKRKKAPRKPGRVSTSTDVRSPTSTDVRSPTRTSTVARTTGNVTVTGGAGAGSTSVNLYSKGKSARGKPARRAPAQQFVVQGVSPKGFWWLSKNEAWSVFRKHAVIFKNEAAADHALRLLRHNLPTKFVGAQVLRA